MKSKFILLPLLIMSGVFGAAEDEVKTASVSVMKGYSLTLNPDFNQTQRFNLIQWRFGDEASTLAQMLGNETSYPDDERFRDRLELNNQTGSLRIRNMQNFGLYSVKISSSKQTSYKIFRVTVSGTGLSSGAVAVICLVLMLMLTTIIVFHSRNKIAILRIREKKTILANIGDDVKLHTSGDLEEGDEILWTYESQGVHIAEIREGVRETYGGADWRFTDKLALDENGSLTIRKIKPKHSGVYMLTIRSCRRRWWSFYKSFTVIVSDKIIPVMEGDDLTLKSETELNKDIQVKWLFENPSRRTPIAEIKGETGEIVTHDGRADGRFRNRLKLDHLTGSLTIMNMGNEHCGFYERQIISSISSKNTIYSLWMVSVRARIVSVEEGKNVTLEIEAEMQQDDQILWMFGAEETLIAQIKGDTRETRDVADGRFRDRLKLEDSGSLSIRNISIEHFGGYKAQIISRGKTQYRKFNVVMLVEYVPVKKGESVTLHTGTKIKESDQIQWMFGDEKTLIAEIKEDTGEISKNDEVFDGRFRGRLELDEQTGSLTITTFTTQHTGLYSLKISRRAQRSINKCFDIFARVRMTSVEKEMHRNRLNESSTVVMSMLNEEAPDGVNEKEGTGSLE